MPSSACKTCARSEEHTSELQSHDNLVCRLLLAKRSPEQFREDHPRLAVCTRRAPFSSGASGVDGALWGRKVGSLGGLPRAVSHFFFKGARAPKELPPPPARAFAV